MNRTDEPPLAVDLLLSLATGPFLVGLVALNSINELLRELGQNSEEMFRGDRLPVIPSQEAPPEQ